MKLRLSILILIASMYAYPYVAGQHLYFSIMKPYIGVIYSDILVLRGYRAFYIEFLNIECESLKYFGFSGGFSVVAPNVDISHTDRTTFIWRSDYSNDRFEAQYIEVDKINSMINIRCQ